MALAALIALLLVVPSGCANGYCIDKASCTNQGVLCTTACERRRWFQKRVCDTASGARLACGNAPDSVIAKHEQMRQKRHQVLFFMGVFMLTGMVALAVLCFRSRQVRWEQKVKELAGRGLTLAQILDVLEALYAETKFIPTVHQTWWVVCHYVIPSTYDSGHASSYAEKKNEGRLIFPGTFVTHHWNNLFIDSVAAIVAHALGESTFGNIPREIGSSTGLKIFRRTLRKEHLEKTYWLCPLSVDQHISICHKECDGRKCSCNKKKHLSGVDCEMDKFAHLLSYLLEKVPGFKQLVALDENLHGLERAWVVQELFTCYSKKIPQFAMMADGTILPDRDVHGIRNARKEKVRQIDVRNCKASSPADLQMILDGIADKVKFNRTVQDLLLDDSDAGIWAKRSNIGADEAAALRRSLALDSELEKAVLQWTCDVIKRESGTTSLFEWLKDGTALCEVVNAIKPNTVNISRRRGPVYDRDRVDCFLDAVCDIIAPSMGVPPFDPRDLCEGKDLVAVVNCILHLNGVIKYHRANFPEFVGPVLPDALARPRAAQKVEKRKKHVPSQSSGNHGVGDDQPAWGWTLAPGRGGVDPNGVTPDACNIDTTCREQYEQKLQRLDFSGEERILESLTGIPRNGRNIEDWIGSGYELCSGLNKWFGEVIQKSKIKVPGTQFDELPPLHKQDNIMLFQDVLRRLGVAKSFDFNTNDVTEGKRPDRFFKAIGALGRVISEDPQFADLRQRLQEEGVTLPVKQKKA